MFIFATVVSPLTDSPSSALSRPNLFPVGRWGSSPMGVQELSGKFRGYQEHVGDICETLMKFQGLKVGMIKITSNRKLILSFINDEISSLNLSKRHNFQVISSKNQGKYLPFTKFFVHYKTASPIELDRFISNQIYEKNH